MSQNRIFHYLILFVLCIIAFFIHRDSFYVNIMEARNFVTAREMIEKANWLVPTMNGELRLAKPPFPTWVTAMFGYWFGIDNVSMLRFPAGIMASLMVFFIYAFTNTLTRNRRIALINGLVLGTSLYVFYMGRTGTWDIYCHSFMLGAIWFLLKALQGDGQSWGSFLLTGVFLGLSFLSKGPVSFYALLLPFIISYLFLFRGGQIKRKWAPLLMAFVVFLVISFWWPLYIYMMHAEEATAVAQLESNSWINRHVRPFWYYWNFPIQSGIWTIFLTSALIFPYGLGRFKDRKGYRFVLFWTLFSVILLSLFPEKKDRYLLPVLIPAALLIGYFLDHLINVYKEKRYDIWDEWLLRINTFCVAIVALSFPALMYFLFYQSGYISLFLFLIIGMLMIGLFVFFIWSYRRRSIYGIIGGVIFFVITLLGVVLPHADPLINSNPDFRNIREVRDLPQVSDLSLYSCGPEQFRIELVWEIGREVKPWDIDKCSTLPHDGPFAIFSTRRPEEFLPVAILSQVDVQILGYYDNNRYSKGSSRYKPFFLKYLSILTPKNEVSDMLGK